ncbi:DUF3450 domain-containing protein [Marinospirillum sp.]|uniref:DUF3450 domain-containing protein n=1 Tax=Marinospirillum sp. TaxID=2183934 RepID=UPI003A84C790
MKKNACGLLAGVLLTTLAAPAMGAASEQVRAQEQATQAAAQSIQVEVEKLDQQRREDFERWRQVRRETLLLEAHNRRLQEWNRNLSQQIQRLERQLASLDATREQLDPLMEEMAERLEAFIHHDLPFQQKERLERAQALQVLLTRVDVSQAEKLRQLLNRYRHEVAEGRTLATSREFIQLEANQAPERLQLLRVGRIGLYYLSEDQQRAGVWKAETQSWQPLNNRQRAQVAKGLELADERGLPELLNLPLSVPLRQAEGGQG